MAPNQKTGRACKAMKDLGIAAKTVKPVLKNLLKLYDNNWMLIEDENYRVLLEAIFEHQESKIVESKMNETCLLDEVEDSEPPFKRSCQRKQKEQASFSMGNLNPGLGGTSSIRPQLDEIVESKMNETCLLDEVEDSEPPFKRSCQRKQKEQASFSMGNLNPGLGGTSSIRPQLDEVELSKTPRRGKITKPSQLSVDDEQNGSKPVSTPQCDRDEGKISNSPQTCPELRGTKSSQLCLGDRTAASYSFSSQTCLREKRTTLASPQIAPIENGSERETCIVCFEEPMVEPGILTPIENVLTESNEAVIMPKREPFIDDSLPLEVIPHAITCPALPNELFEDGSSNGNSSSGKADGLDFLESKYVEDEGNDVSNSSQFDIAASPKGEVKISLIFNSSRPSDFRIRSLDEVLKLAENKFLKSYKITESSFSVRKLMKDLCECFLAASTDSNEVSRSTNVITIPDILKETNARDVFGGTCDYQGNFCFPPIANGSVKFQNVIEILSQIPRPIGPNGLETLQCIVGLDENLIKDICSRGHRKMKALKSFESCVNDITRGQERVMISLVNEISTEHSPTFFYIPRNLIYENAYLNFALARISDEDCCSHCFGDCLSLSIPCACAHKTGGEFAYTLGGLVKDKFLEEFISMNRDSQQHRFFYCQDCPLERSKNGKKSNPCKGHLMRKFIKECWYKCGCSKGCGNHVVQRGITANLQVFLTPEGKGWGLRTLEDLPKGAFVCEYVGEIVTNTEQDERNRQSTRKHTYSVLLDADWISEGVLRDEEALCLDATLYGNVARFINHRCSDANLVAIPVEVETPDHHYYHHAFFTTRKVDAMEEIIWDYGIDFNDCKHPAKAFQCLCGSKFCRGLKLSKS